MCKIYPFAPKPKESLLIMTGWQYIPSTNGTIPLWKCPNTHKLFSLDNAIKKIINQ